NDWYYFNPTSGRMQKNWLQGGNDWYYFNSSSGRMQKGWLDEKGDWYYFKNNGMMATGYYNGYLFSNSGKWISNFTLTGLGAKDFISQIGEVAKIVADEYGIYASMMIAQAGLESGWGSSMLSQQAHNLFGVKWSGKGNYVTMPTLEYYGGAYHTVNAPFAAYNTYYESLVGYATMIKTRFPKSTKSYSPTYQDAARNLRNGIYGTYATDPEYASKLISVINTYGLYKYDI
ncbi:MAG: glucosaminidase domain-containing protein, partial [Ligilactobacillus salivarius]|nr:glucosaminidase domain-containing protein [Ligilactobacillus salivarius]